MAYTRLSVINGFCNLWQMRHDLPDTVTCALEDLKEEFVALRKRDREQKDVTEEEWAGMGAEIDCAIEIDIGKICHVPD